MRLTNQSGYNTKDQAYFAQFQNRGYAGHKKASTAAWNMEGNLLATGESSLKIWSFDPVAGLQSIVQARGIDSSMGQLKFYGQNLLASLNKQSVRLYDVRDTIKAIKTEKKNKADMITSAWNYEASVPYFAVLQKQNTVNIYDMRNFQSLLFPVASQKVKNDITEIEWDRTGSVLFCAGGDSSSSVLMMYSNTLQPITQLISPHNSKINSISIDTTNRYIATGSDDSLTCISTLPDVICERTYSHTDCAIRKVAFSSKAEYLAVSCEEPKTESTSNKGQEVKVAVQQPCIDFYNVTTGGHAYRIKCGNTQQVLEWHPKKPILAYFDYDEQDKKRPGSQREERYLHIFGI